MSRLRGPLVGAVALVGTVALALSVSGRFPLFAQNRGLLQLVVAIPAACFVVAAALTHLGVLRVSDVAWSLVPAAALLLVLGYVMLLEAATLPALLLAGGAAGIPWLAGAWAAATLGKRKARRRTPPGPPSADR